MSFNVAHHAHLLWHDVAEIDRLLADGLDVSDVQNAFVRDVDAQHDFRGGAYSLRCPPVTSPLTAGGQEPLGNWRQAARRKIDSLMGSWSRWREHPATADRCLAMTTSEYNAKLRVGDSKHLQLFHEFSHCAVHSTYSTVYLLNCLGKVHCLELQIMCELMDGAAQSIEIVYHCFSYSCHRPAEQILSLHDKPVVYGSGYEATPLVCVFNQLLGEFQRFFIIKQQQAIWHLRKIKLKEVTTIGRSFGAQTISAQGQPDKLVMSNLGAHIRAVHHSDCNSGSHDRKKPCDQRLPFPKPTFKTLKFRNCEAREHANENTYPVGRGLKPTCAAHFRSPDLARQHRHMNAASSSSEGR